MLILQFCTTIYCFPQSSKVGFRWPSGRDGSCESDTTRTCSIAIKIVLSQYFVQLQQIIVHLGPPFYRRFAFEHVVHTIDQTSEDETFLDLPHSCVTVMIMADIDLNHLHHILDAKGSGLLPITVTICHVYETKISTGNIGTQSRTSLLTLAYRLR